MTLNLLFDHFDQLITRPEDIPRLNGAILQLAVQSKLLPQDPVDEPASELLKRIRAEKDRLLLTGQISRDTLLPMIGDDEIPYELPESWVWVRLPEIYHDWGQKRPNELFTYIDVSSINNEVGVIGDELQVIAPENAPSRARKLVRRGTVIYSTVRPYLLNVAIVDRDYDPSPIVSTAFAVMHPLEGICNEFLFYYLRSKPFVDFVEAQMTGMAYPAINDTKLNLGLFPLPPLAEQKRIVAKVESLLVQTRALAAELAAAKQERARLNRASLHHLLAAPTPTDFAARWHFVAAHFDGVTADPASVNELKQSILQLAVQGQLIPQNPTEEPASALIKWIRAEKDRLLLTGEISRDTPLPPISEDEIPYELPPRWVWVRLGNISKNIHYGYTASADFSQQDVRLLRITDIQNGKVNWETVPGCEISENEVSKYLLVEDDILIARTGGTIGKSFLIKNVKVKAVFASYLIRVIPLGINSVYLKTFLESPLYWTQLTEKSKGTGQPNVNATSLSQLIIPLPPLAEQKRIVAKVECLLRLCDELKAGLVAGEAARARLLESMLYQVVNGVSVS